jgi:hypothetical protein
MPMWMLVLADLVVSSRMSRSFCAAAARGGLDRGDLAEPALFPGLLEPAAEVGVDLPQPEHLGWVDPEEGHLTAPSSWLGRLWAG